MCKHCSKKHLVEMIDNFGNVSASEFIVSNIQGHRHEQEIHPSHQYLLHAVSTISGSTRNYIVTTRTDDEKRLSKL